ncbi:mannose-1-phosphate guanylyltransferase/mannose-6-phosphate isomerase [Hyphomicrobiales bacterium 4NK60-0047b]
MITPVILCGGTGTRLWPLSRKSLPKQFAPIVGDKSLYQLTLERCSKLSDEIITVASEDHRFMVLEAMNESGVKGAVILEPMGRNTAAAMALAALNRVEIGTGDDLLLFCPADHFVPDLDAFAETIKQGVSSAQSGAIVTYGIVPTFPSTAYGYIQQGEKRACGGLEVVRFIEKPEAEKAQELLLGGDVSWNAGIFLATANTIVKALKEHAPEILENCEAAMKASKKTESNEHGVLVEPEKNAFAICPSKSIDYAVMETHENKVVIPFHGQWSDVGSWNAVADLTEPGVDGNRIDGQGVAQNSKDTYIHAPHRPVVALGVKDLLIVDTADAVLVAEKGSAEQVRDVVAELEKRGFMQALTHRKVARPWGWYDCVDIGHRFQVKRIGVKPGASLSLQKHHHRAEHWVVVRGTAEVTCGEDVFLLSENQSTYIPVGEIHRLKNPGKIQLEMIEVQSGTYLGEDDIVRLDDTYGRVKHEDGGENK